MLNIAFGSRLKGTWHHRKGVSRCKPEVDRWLKFKTLPRGETINSEPRGFGFLVAVLLVPAVLGGIYGPNVRATTASADDYQTAVRDFTRVLNVVQSNYADTVDVDKAVYQGAIPGMLRMLDPHSSFFDAKQFSLLPEAQRGKYYAVGMIVAPPENHTVVMAPYVGAP